MWGWNSGWGWGWWPMGLMMLLFWAGAIAFGVWVVVRLTGGHRHDGGGFLPGRGSEARRILEERFARGEIDAEEFERRLRVLER